MVIIKIENNQPKGWVEGGRHAGVASGSGVGGFGGEYRWLEDWLDQHESVVPGCHQIAEHFWLLV